MKQLLKLTIPKPCSQSWNEMSQTDTGRYCKSCNKCVGDFTNFSDAQLKDFFGKTKDKVCEQFTTDQINRLLIGKTNSKHSQFIPQLLISSVLTIGLGNTDAKGIIFQNFQEQTEIKLQAERKNYLAYSADSLNYISGKIIDFENKELLPFVRVSIKGTKYGIASDIEANFKLIIPDSLIGKEITLLFASVGYEEKEMKLSIHELPITTEIHLKKSLNALRGEVIIISAYSVNGTSFWNRIFHKKEKKSECK